MLVETKQILVICRRINWVLITGIPYYLTLFKFFIHISSSWGKKAEAVLISMYIESLRAN